MGIFDKVKKILFDDEEIEDLPVRTDKAEKVKEEKKNDLFEELEKEEGGVVIHNEVDEDTITEVKVPTEKNESFIFPVKVDDEEEIPSNESTNTQELRLQEDEFDRTQEIERLREKNLTKSREDYIKEYTESRRIQKDIISPRREIPAAVEKKEKAPFKVPPVISPVFGILDKDYDSDSYEETKKKITLTNSGNSTKKTERQFGPVSFLDQGIPEPLIKSKTVIIATVDPSENLKEELKKENEKLKESNEIEDEILNNIINDTIESHDIIEDELEDTNKIEPVNNIIEEKVEEPTIEYETPKKKEVELPEVLEDEVEEEDDAVITGSPYDDLLEEEEKSTPVEPTVNIDDLIKQNDEMEEADLTPDAPKNIEENEKLDDTIETDLYNLIDSMYKDEE